MIHNPNNRIRSHFKLKVKHGIEKAREVNTDHPGLKGKFREIIISDMIEPILPPGVSWGSGQLIDVGDRATKQIDIIVYSKQVLPPATFYDDKNGFYPIESALYSIEVKSEINSTTLKEAVENAKSHANLKLIPTWEYKRGEREEFPMVYPIPVLLGLKSDLRGTESDEFERYKKIDANWNTKPAFPVICVIGKAYWSFFNGGRGEWLYTKASEEFDEVLDFLSGITNSIPKILSQKGTPHFGNYLSSGRSFESI